MSSRREFLAKTAIASGFFAFSGAGDALTAQKYVTSTAPASQNSASSSSSRPLRILILGGTGFIGPHHVRAAVERGHEVSVFNRGKRSAELPSDVEHLIGDRNGDLTSIKGREWDAVLDMAAYGPAWVRALGQAIKDRVKHYTFISTAAVYEDSGDKDKSTDEKSQVVTYKDAADPYSITESTINNYAQLKVLCEKEAELQFRGKTLIIRPGVIGGPGDQLGFTYLAARMDAGGEVLAAGDPLMQVQIIDIRDLAEWIIRMVELGETGIFNAAGPALPLGWAEMLGALRGGSRSPVKLTWIPLSWLREQKINLTPWANRIVLFPIEYGFPGLMRMSNEKARGKGLEFRPICATGTDALAWFKNQPVATQAKILGSDEALQSERAVLAAWHAHQSGA